MWRDVWQYRDLVWTLGLRDVKLVYRQTLLGILWVVLQPLLGAIIFAFVFGAVSNLPSGPLPYFLVTYTGMLVWTLFSQTLQSSSLALVNHSHLITKVYFPRLVLPIATLFQPVVNFLVGCTVLVAALLYYQVGPGWWLVLAPLPVCGTLLLALGFGLSLGSLAVRYRDVKHVLPVAVQLLFFVSPVGYTLAAVAERTSERVTTLYRLNPLAEFLSAFRTTVTGHGGINWPWLFYALLLTGLIFVIGLATFRRTERTFADVV